jgi:hypothetical protein
MRKCDMQCRKCEESFTLPSPSYQGEQFDSISQLLVVPGLPHLIFGCHHSGSFAIWWVYSIKVTMDVWRAYFLIMQSFPVTTNFSRYA